MNKFISFLAPNLESFVTYKKSTGHFNKSYEIQLSLFDKYCHNEFKDNEILSQEIVDVWCKKRKTESNNSCRSRINVVISFIEYLNKRKLTNINKPLLPKQEPTKYIPHAFTEKELKNFFRACDELPASDSKIKRLRKLTIPVIFRLLYSSGIRTIEARLLQTSDINFSNGVVSIRNSKGPNQHFVVLHDTMIDLLKIYNQEIEMIFPNRDVFFPDRHGKAHKEVWISENFRNLWHKYNNSHAVAYDLRHNYATENINSWTSQGFNFESKLLSLSKSMGHYSTESTRYYYSLVPKLADTIEELLNDDDIIPEVSYEIK